jgi:hypothetical protein
MRARIGIRLQHGGTPRRNRATSLLDYSRNLQVSGTPFGN